MVQSACSDCHAKGMCNLGDMKEKLVDVNLDDQTWNVNEQVMVYTRAGTGLFSALLAYLLPVILIVASLFTASVFKIPEITSGLLSIAILGPYFIMLYIFRDRLKQKIQFHIQKTE